MRRCLSVRVGWLAVVACSVALLVLAQGEARAQEAAATTDKSFDATAALSATLDAEAGAALATENDWNGEAPPAGYESTAAVQAAITAGELELVDGDDYPVPASVTVEKGIVYGRGGEVELKLDLYSPKEIGEPVPGIVFIHGGGWRGGNRDDYHYYCVKFAERGYVVATVTYRLVPEAIYPAAIEDVKCAVRWMRANAERIGVNPELIAAAGGSAGGHLSMMIGYSSDVPELEGEGGHAGVSSRVAAVVNLYGPTDLTVPVAIRHPSVLGFFGGKTIDEVRRSYEMASPLYHVTPDDPPTLTFQGTVDDTVPVEQADVLALKLTAAGVPFRYDRLEGWPHSMDVAVVINERVRAIMAEFFAEHLPLPE